MIEYRLYSLPNMLRLLLEEADAFICEEEFKGITTYLIYSEDDISDLLQELNIQFDAVKTEETGWQDRWKEYIKEDYLTDNLFFIFEKGKTFQDNRKTIYINPSLAFGTGTHATTQAAARLLEPVSYSSTLLDVGTGSGILAITASLSGAKSIDAFDIDPMTLQNSQENISNNNCSNISVWTGEISSIKDKSYDIVCANIISSVLLSIKDDIERLAEKYIIYSGILVSEYEELMPVLKGSMWEEDEKIIINEWVGIRLVKNI